MSSGNVTLGFIVLALALCNARRTLRTETLQQCYRLSQCWVYGAYDGSLCISSMLRLLHLDAGFAQSESLDSALSNIQDMPMSLGRNLLCARASAASAP